MTYTLYSDVENNKIASTHRTLKGAGRAYQSAHTGNMRRVLDGHGDDVTAAAVSAWLDAQR